LDVKDFIYESWLPITDLSGKYIGSERRIPLFRAQETEDLQMRKVLLSTVAAFLLSGAVQSPSHADAGAIVKFPVTLTSIAAGTAIGTPIAMIRKSAADTKECCDKLSDNGGMIKKAGASVIALPVGIVKGTVQGAILGPKNAFKNSGENPFSKDCFSMGDLD
jgi:hypothetical protein